jgi:hypothetical protein
LEATAELLGLLISLKYGMRRRRRLLNFIAHKSKDGVNALSTRMMIMMMMMMMRRRRRSRGSRRSRRSRRRPTI